MDLHPTSTVFNAGNRLRVAVMGADADNTESDEASAARPVVRVYRSERFPSGIELPIAGG